MSMDFEVHCILPTELSLFNCDEVNSVVQSIAPLIGSGQALLRQALALFIKMNGDAILEEKSCCV